MADAGMFSRRFGAVLFLNELSIQALRPVVLPNLSSVHRDGESVADAYQRAAVLKTGVTWPMFAGVSLLALPMIVLLFGDQWGDAAPIAAILAMWGACHAFHCFAADALVAVGKERMMLLMEVVLFSVRLIGIIIGASQGLEVVASALVVAGVLEFAIGFWAVWIGFGLGPLGLIRALVPRGIIAGLCWLSIWGTLSVLEGHDVSGTLAMFASAAVAVPVWLAGLFGTRHPLADELLRLVASRRISRLMPIRFNVLRLYLVHREQRPVCWS